MKIMSLILILTMSSTLTYTPSLKRGAPTPRIQYIIMSLTDHTTYHLQLVHQLQKESFDPRPHSPYRFSCEYQTPHVPVQHLSVLYSPHHELYVQQSRAHSHTGQHLIHSFLVHWTPAPPRTTGNHTQPYPLLPTHSRVEGWSHAASMPDDTSITPSSSLQRHQVRHLRHFVLDATQTNMSAFFVTCQLLMSGV